MTEKTVARLWLDDAMERFRSMKALADRALAQIDEEAFHWQYDEESNSVAVIVRHMSGNMVSRWTDFLTSDGEKPDRNRDTEFIDDLPMSELLGRWEHGWSLVFDALAGLRDEDVTATVTIRGEPHSVVEAVNRQISHYAYHVGQLVYVCKMCVSGRWHSLSIPRGTSQEFNTAMSGRHGDSTVGR